MENIKTWKIKSSTSSLNLCVPDELAQVAVIEAQEWQGFPNTDKEWEILPPQWGESPGTGRVYWVVEICRCLNLTI